MGSDRAEAPTSCLLDVSLLREAGIKEADLLDNKTGVPLAHWLFRAFALETIVSHTFSVRHQPFIADTVIICFFVYAEHSR